MGARMGTGFRPAQLQARESLTILLPRARRSRVVVQDSDKRSDSLHFVRLWQYRNLGRKCIREQESHVFSVCCIHFSGPAPVWRSDCTIPGMATQTIHSANLLAASVGAHHFGSYQEPLVERRHRSLSAHRVARHRMPVESEESNPLPDVSPAVEETPESARGLSVEQYGAAYQAGFPRTVRFLRSRGANEDAAEEIAQAAWSRGWERLHQLRTPEALEVWIASIAKHMFSAQAIRLQRCEEIEENTAACGPSATSLLWNEIVRCCQPEERKLLSLHYVSGYSSAEIAKKLGCSALAVRLRLMRVRRKIDANLPASTFALAA